MANHTPNHVQEDDTENIKDPQIQKEQGLVRPRSPKLAESDPLTDPDLAVHQVHPIEELVRDWEKKSLQPHKVKHQVEDHNLSRILSILLQSKSKSAWVRKQCNIRYQTYLQAHNTMSMKCQPS